MDSVTRELKNIPIFAITPCLLGIIFSDSYISYLFFPFRTQHKVDQLEVNEHLIEANDLSLCITNDF